MLQEISIETQFTIPHWGYFEMHLCEDASIESEECFRKLRFGNGDMHRHILFGTPQWINTTIVLPTDVSCKQCVLRLHYRGGYEGDCDDGTQGYFINWTKKINKKINFSKYLLF